VEFRTLFMTALASLAFTAAPLTSASAQGTNAKDAAELKSYRLTMDGIRKLSAAGEAMQKAIENDPRFKEEASVRKDIEALEKKDELTPAEEKKLDDLRNKLEEIEAKNDKDNDKNRNPETIDEMAKQIESVPEMAKAIKSAGLSPREYSVLSLVTFQAMMAHGMQKQYGTKELPKEFQGTVLADNIKFVADNEAEINRLLEKLKKP
jgi:predicted phage tail protein